MKKIDRAVEIIRGWSGEELKALIDRATDKPLKAFAQCFCPSVFGLGKKELCDDADADCKSCDVLEHWNEEVEK